MAKGYVVEPRISKSGKKSFRAKVDINTLFAAKHLKPRLPPIRMAVKRASRLITVLIETWLLNPIIGISSYVTRLTNTLMDWRMYRKKNKIIKIIGKKKFSLSLPYYQTGPIPH